MIVVDESMKRLEKRVDDLEPGSLGRQLAEEMAQWRVAGGEGEWARCLSRKHDSQTVLAKQSLSPLRCMYVPEQADTTCRFMLLLVSSPSYQTPSSTSVVMLFGSDENQVKTSL